MSDTQNTDIDLQDTLIIDYKNVDELFPLGKEYTDRITGFKGIATSRQLHHNGCITFSIEPSEKDKKKKGWKARILNVVRLIGELIHEDLKLEVSETVKHPLLDTTVVNEHTEIEGLVTVVHRTIEGFDHVYVLPPGNVGGKQKDLVEFSVKEIGVRHEGNLISPVEYVKLVSPAVDPTPPVSTRSSPVNLENVHHKFPH